MEELEVTCQVSCQKCGWSTGTTIFTEEANIFNEILKFCGLCSPRHLGSVLSGKLLVTWESVKSESY